MTATGPLAEQREYSDREFLDTNVGSKHLSLYKNKSVIFQPLSIVLWIFFGFGGFLFFVLQEKYPGQILNYLPAFVIVESLCTIPWRIKRIRENKLVKEFYNGKNIVLEKPRWIPNVGYVNRLHDEDLDKGDKIELSPKNIAKEGIYFLKNMKCVNHENKQEWRKQSCGDGLDYVMVRDCYQIAYFDLNGSQLILKRKCSSPAFDTSNHYHFLFKINQVSQTLDEMGGDILNLFVSDSSRETIPEEKGGIVPKSPQTMIINNSKAAIA